MPAQKSTSGFAKKFGSKLNSALKEHSTKAPEVKNFGDLPPGISGGVAQLTECKFAEYKTGDYKGQYFFMAMGTVISPAEGPKGEQIKGLFTQMGPLPCCQTKNRAGVVTSEEDNAKKVQDVLKLLGAAAESIDTAEGMENTAAALKKMGPYFKFSTSAGKVSDEYPNPKTFQNWLGVKGLENYSPDESSTVEDNSPEAPADDAPTDEPTESGEGDLDELAVAADDSDNPESDTAKSRLTELANERGIDDDAVSGADDWASVVALIRAAGEAPAEPEKPFEPAKNTVVLYTPSGKKKGVECNVELVDKKSKKVNLKNLEDGKTLYKAVPYAEVKKLK